MEIEETKDLLNHKREEIVNYAKNMTNSFTLKDAFDRQNMFKEVISRGEDENIGAFYISILYGLLGKEEKVSTKKGLDRIIRKNAYHKIKTSSNKKFKENFSNFNKIEKNINFLIRNNMIVINKNNYVFGEFYKKGRYILHEININAFYHLYPEIIKDIIESEFNSDEYLKISFESDPNILMNFFEEKGKKQKILYEKYYLSTTK